jgi:hypothetical protein
LTRESARRLSKDEILSALRPSDVLQHFGIEGQRSGHQLRTRLCPACGPRNRDAVVIELATGRWYDHAHDCKGDLLALVAGYSGLDLRTEFVQVLERASLICGLDGEVTPTASPAPRPLAAVPPPDAGDREADREQALRWVPRVWDGLKRTSFAGVAYLRARGLDGLDGRDDLVRFSPLEVAPQSAWGKRVARLLGSPAVCVPVHGIDDDVIVNVSARRLEPQGEQPKVVSLPLCSKVANGRLVGTFGRWRDFAREPRDTVLVEGVFDYLSAVTLWPDLLVLGADGASLLPHMARAVAPAIAAAGRRLLLVPHKDTAGSRANVAAGKEAITAGLRLQSTLVILNVGPHGDLNDALRGGTVPDVR